MNEYLSIFKIKIFLIILIFSSYFEKEYLSIFKLSLYHILINIAKNLVNTILLLLIILII